jgi:tRNA dimethylallyltransferase
MSSRVLILVGPTAVGKTDLSILLAQQLQCDIISADSRQIYRYMDIGTAKPDAGQLATVRHHFIDIKNPDDYYSAGQFGEEARQLILEQMSGTAPPIVVGGSGLYIRALVDGFYGGRIADAAVKDRLRTDVEEAGLASLYSRLSEIDPELAARLPATDTQRILRALEVFEITGRPFSEFQDMQSQPADFEAVFVGLTRDRENLYGRIEKRVDLMIQAGLVDEVKRLREMGFDSGLNALKTVGYQESFAYFDGIISKKEMIALIKQKSRNYAKRQYTWFRKDERIRWVDLDEVIEPQEQAASILQLFE